MIATIGSLVVLALIDSTIFGTLLIPLGLLTAPGRLRIGRLLLFLSVVAGSYFALGVALLFGATSLLGSYSHLFESTSFRYVQLIAGIALLVISHFMDTEKARARAAERAARGDNRILRWRSQVMSGKSSSSTTGSLIGLALVAVFLEATTMLPYLAGIGIITAEGPGFPSNLLLLLGYCFVMILPALLLTCIRIVARSAIEKPLIRLNNWLMRNAQSTTAWIIGIVGFILAAQAASVLWFATSTR